MTLVLLRSLIANRGYQEDAVITGYLKWANTPGTPLGKNTRALFKGVTTVKGYRNRIAKIHQLPEAERSQSNGAMMRCSPLALLPDYTAVLADVSLTNPTPVAIDTNLVYITALRDALNGLSPAEIFTHARSVAQTQPVKEIFEQVLNRGARNISESKGWCLHALWCTMIALTSFTTYTEAMAWIIKNHPGSDSDTNACIAGALLGAVLGFHKLESQQGENIQILLSVPFTAEPTPRPLEYTPHDFYAVTTAAYQLTQ
jgi:ADP-ribosylglycohydrolase